MKQLQKPAPTFESVWAFLEKSSADFDRRMKEADQRREESNADWKRRMQESDQRRKESNADWERRMQEADQRRKESSADWERRMQESDRQRAESRANFERELKESSAKFDREMEKSRADWERRMQESDQRREESRADWERRMQESDKRLKKIEALTGSWANNNGSFAEEYFFNSFEKGKQNFFGEKFDEIEKNLKSRWQGLKDEYDIVLYNHTSVALIEVKYKAHVNDIPSVLKKAETFRILYPHYKDFKIYLGLASMSFYPELEQKCINQGIAIIKQIGGTVVINDEHLKVF